MAEEKKEETKNEIERFETRKFRYSNEVTFEFELEVSNAEAAVAEITDFIDLMARATKDLTELRDHFQKQIEPKEKEKPKENVKTASKVEPGK